MALGAENRYLDTPALARDFIANLETFGVADVELEIGCSHGIFLTQLARAHPEKCFVGVEWKQERAVAAYERASSAQTKNIAIVHLEGYEFLRVCVAAPLFSRVHVYFPTPYPKALGLAGPLVGVDFVRELERTMLLGGEFRLATDHARYFVRAIHCFGEARWMAHSWRNPLVNLSDGLVVGSGCEVWYRLRLAREIHLAALRLVCT